MIIDKYFPPCGPCLICCNSIDARHRIFDVILEKYQAGDSVKDLAIDYNVPEEVILEIIEKQ